MAAPPAAPSNHPALPARVSGPTGSPWTRPSLLLGTAIGLITLAACTPSGAGESPRSDQDPTGTAGPVELFDGRVIPAMPALLGMRDQYQVRLEWLEERHRLLVKLMRERDLDMWIVVSEEFHPDPVMQYLAPPLHYTRRRDVLVLVDDGSDRVAAYSDYWRPTADYARFIEPLPSERNARGIQDTASGLRALVEEFDPRRIALNMNGGRGQNSGLTYDGYRFLSETLGAEMESRFVSAGDLIEAYLDTRIPGEMDHYRDLVLATDVIAQRALSNLVITPGETRASDIKWFFEETIAGLGVGGAPWFEIHVAVQRFDPQSGEMIPYVHPAPDDLVFQRGDIIHLDCGFDYMGLASDWQKVAYILREGESDVPDGLKTALANANLVHEAFARAPRPGMTGWEATLAIASQLEGVPFLPSLYSHPIGNHGHGLGPAINARDMDLSSPPNADSPLREGSYRSVEFSATTAIPEYDGGRVRIPMEDDAYLTPEGYTYFRPYQTEWYVIR